MNWTLLIRELQASGITQQQIAALCNTGQSHISCLALGKRKCPSWTLGERLRALHAERCVDAERGSAPQVSEVA